MATVRPAWIAISDLPPELTAAGYDIYVYALSSQPLYGGGYRVLDASDGHVIRDYVPAQSPAYPTNYIQVPANLGPGHYGIGDYIVFSGLTAENIVIEALAEFQPGHTQCAFPVGEFHGAGERGSTGEQTKRRFVRDRAHHHVPPQSQVAVAGSSPPSRCWPPVQPH